MGEQNGIGGGEQENEVFDDVKLFGASTRLIVYELLYDLPDWLHSSGL